MESSSKSNEMLRQALMELSDREQEQLNEELKHIPKHNFSKEYREKMKEILQVNQKHGM